MQVLKSWFICLILTTINFRYFYKTPPQTLNTLINNEFIKWHDFRYFKPALINDG